MTALRPRRSWPASGGLARVRGEPIDDLVDPAGIEGERVAVDLDGGLAIARHSAADGHLEDARREPQLLEHLGHGRGQGPGRLAPRRRQCPGGPRHVGEQPRVLPLAARPLLVEPAQALDLDGRAFAVLDDRRLVVAVPPQQSVDRRRVARRARRPRAGRDRSPPRAAGRHRPRRRAPPRGRPAAPRPARSAGRVERSRSPR